MQPFTYHRAKSPADARAQFARHDKPAYLAGGVSLVFLMKQGYAAPSHVIDIAHLDGLRTITGEAEAVRIGALVTHAAIAGDALVRAVFPALADLAERVGDPQVRNMGTIGGAVATNDPYGDYPAALVAVDAVVHTDERNVAAADFFTGPYGTALAPGELILGITLPVPRRAAYAKVEQPASRYALVGVMAADTDAGPRVAVIGASPCVQRCEPLETALAGAFDPRSLAGATVSPDGLTDDRRGSAAYRAQLVAVLARRAVTVACLE